jgi:hypothetical protein
MISSEVQRTLVKSPPELWAELSDSAALARHLGELGEIRITRIEPEKTVEWEAADTTGKVLLKASGWGTKVTLTVTREVVAPEPPADPEPAAIAIANESAPPVQAESEHATEVAPEPEPAAVEKPEAVAVEEQQPAVIPKPAPRPGFFARLFRRRPKEQAVPEPPVDEPAVEPEVTAEPEQPSAEEVPPQAAPSEDIPDIAAELKAAEETATEEVTAVLTAALDRLGAAHHRPFSRA